MKRIYIDPGHSKVDPGAVKYAVERDLNEKVAKFMNEYLLATYICETKVDPVTNNSLSAVASAANKWKANLLVSIHFNAGGGDGYEALVYGKNRKAVGQIFEKHVKAAGQNSRGIKYRPGLAVLRLSNMPAVLNEGAFVDNKKDIQDWDEDHELKKLGIAYAEAAAEYLELEKKPVEPEQEEPQTVFVQLPVLRNGDNNLPVEALQVLLNGRKYPCGTVDGEFGAATEKATKSLQKKNDLPVTGIVGAAEWDLLFNT